MSQHLWLCWWRVWSQHCWQVWSQHYCWQVWSQHCCWRCLVFSQCSHWKFYCFEIGISAALALAVAKGSLGGSVHDWSSVSGGAQQKPQSPSRCCCCCCFRDVFLASSPSSPFCERLRERLLASHCASRLCGADGARGTRLAFSSFRSRRRI